MTPSPSASPRFHALDALRAFALLLGVVFHAAESFMAGHPSWAIVDASPSSALALFRYASHSFRLEIFFLMAGFFARLLYHRRGGSGFWKNRFSRILVPLVVGWCVLYPLLVYLWINGAVKSGRWDFLEVPPEMRHLAPWQLTLGFFFTLQFLRKFDLTHLWFLHQLLVLYVVVLGFRFLLVSLVDRRGTVAGWWDRQFERVLASRWSALWLALPTVPLLFLMDSWDVDTPKTSLIPELGPTLVYGYFFLAGWALHRQPSLLQTPARRWVGLMLVAAALVWPTDCLPAYFYQTGLAQDHYFWARSFHALLYALMMWSFVLAFTGLFVRACPAASPVWRYVADASYWIYLVHLPLVVSLQIWVADWPVHWTLKFSLINLIAFPLLFLSYHYLVRSTFLGARLNGRRYPFVPWFGARGAAD